MSGATVALTLSSNAIAFDSGEQVGLGGCEVGGSAGSLGGGGCAGKGERAGGRQDTGTMQGEV
jgi:hypothetical protein